MNKIIYFKPKHILNSEQNLNNFINHCKTNLALYNWDSNSWQHKQGNRNIAMVFSKYNSISNSYNFEPFDEPFLSFAKAYIRYQQSLNAVSSVTNKMVALRILHDSIFEIDSEANILKISGAVLNKLFELTEKRITNRDRINKVGYQIEILLNFIREKQIIPSLQDWRNPWPKVKAIAERTDEKSRQWQQERCPSVHQMLTLADCFAKAITNEDKYWSSVITLLMFSPSRASELSELTIDCLHRGDSNALGIKWYGKKGFGFTIKWVPKILEEIVIEAFQRLLEIGKPARDAAKYSHNNPYKFKSHDNCITPNDFTDDTQLNALEFAFAMNFQVDTIERIKKKTKDYNSTTAWQVLGSHQTKWIQQMKLNNGPTYNMLAEYINQQYRTYHWPYLPFTGQPIWKSLILIRDREFHKEFKPRMFSWCIPSVNTINAQISSRNRLKNPIPTIFQRMGFKDENNLDINITSHQIRVWLSTNAERAGMDAWLLARWAGRARINDNRHYDLRTQEEREQQTRAVLKQEEKPNVIKAIQLNLPVSYQDLGINRPGIADITEYGMCIHDYSMMPCTKAGECMTCKEHACIKGMPNTLEKIITLECLIESQFTQAKNETNNGIFGADRWVTYLGWKLAHLKVQRERLESDETSDGTILWIPIEHDPSPIQRALKQQIFNTTESAHEYISKTITSMSLGLNNAKKNNNE